MCHRNRRWFECSSISCRAWLSENQFLKPNILLMHNETNYYNVINDRITCGMYFTLRINELHRHKLLSLIKTDKLMSLQLKFQLTLPVYFLDWFNYLRFRNSIETYNLMLLTEESYRVFIPNFGLFLFFLRHFYSGRKFQC